MAENSAIEWCDHTFNPWEGCQKVGPGCDHCYAERRNARFGGGVAVNWGPGAPKRRTSAGNWRKPRQWQADASTYHAALGRRQRVFCASLGDVFDNEVPEHWRWDLFRLIAATPDLNWLLLTKRIGNAHAMLNSAAAAVAGEYVGAAEWDRQPWPNVSIGITVVNQAEADRDVPKLLHLPATARFLSVEPMLGPIDLTRIDICGDFEIYPLKGTTECVSYDDEPLPDLPALSWVICGGESGPKARPMHPDWARSLRDQCAAAGVPFLFKQWGEWCEQDDSGLPGVRLVLEGDPEFESEAAKCDAFMAIDGEFITDLDDGRDGMSYRGLSRPGKRAAGRLLDGRTHDEFPAP